MRIGGAGGAGLKGKLTEGSVSVNEVNPAGSVEVRVVSSHRGQETRPCPS